jgi:hypothetical protein
MLAEIQWSWGAIFFSLLALLVAVSSMHFLLRNIRNVKQSKWGWRQSTGVTAVVLFLCGMAIAFSGIIHQLAWLGREKIIERSGVPESTRVIGSLKDIYVTLRNYEFYKDAVPPSINHAFKEMGLDEDDYERCMRPILRIGDSLVYYHFPVLEAPPNAVLAHTASPAYSRGWVCLMADGAARWVIDKAELEAMQKVTLDYLKERAGSEEEQE